MKMLAKNVALVVLVVVVVLVSVGITAKLVYGQKLPAIEAIELVYSVPTPEPLMTGQVKFSIDPQNRHLMVTDDQGVGVDMHNLAYIVIKIENILKAQVGGE
jgi:hypothetical protein